MGDVARPGVDLGPVAEVALREHRAGSRQLPDRPLRKPELARVQGSEEDAMALGPDGTLELGDLLGFGGDGQVAPLGVGGLGAQRAATEQPDRPTGQDGAVPLDECRCLLLPVPA